MKSDVNTESDADIENFVNNFTRNNVDGEHKPDNTDHEAVEATEAAEAAEDGEGSGKPSITIKDHFTLSNPTSTITFGKKTTHVIANGTEQITLEESGDSLEVKQISTGTAALYFVRGAYTFIAVLMTGFIFVFCCQLILLLFMVLAIQSGSTSKQDNLNAFTVVGILLSIPTVAIGLASVMNIASNFVLDTWRGHRFTKILISSESVLTNWITVFIFFLSPIVVGTCCLFAQSDRWWEITSLSWFSCVFAYFLLFAIAVIYYELRGCYEMVRYNKKNDKEYEERSLTPVKEFFDVIRRAIFMRQNEMFGGTMKVSGIAYSNDIDRDFLEDLEPQVGFLTKIMLKLENLGLYKKIKDQDRVRIYDVDEVNGRYPMVTTYTWGLEEINLRNRKDHFISIIAGEDAITSGQAKSSFVVSILGQLFTLVAIISISVWIQTGPYFIIGVIIIYTLYSSNRIYTSYALRKMFSDALLKPDSKKSTKKAEALYYVEARYRIVEPTTKFCRFLLCAEIVLFGLYPMIAFFMSRDSNMAWEFTVISTITTVRRYLSAAVCFRELGTLDGIEKNNKDKSKYEEWREKNVLSNIVCSISQGCGNNFWVGVFALFLFAFSLLFTNAITTGTENGRTEKLKMLNDFIYEGSTDFPYPTCSLGKGIDVPSSDESALADFTFLSSLAYLDPNVTQTSLDNWFGNNTALDQIDIVKQFHGEYEEENEKSAVSYKLIEFPSKNLKIVAIRGTHTPWDALTDAQLWSSAAIAQSIRAIIPLGEIWTPILRHLVKLVSQIESRSLKDVSFYKETTAFVQKLKSEQNEVALTGHSLGGGLAMITGVQTKSPALAISGPNSLISRDTFYPPLEEVDINRYTFNVIPDRDPVPRVDDPGQNYQRISCSANVNDPFSCHHAVRTLCEILYTCGTQMRPALCACHNKYKYPKPTAIGNRTYEEACPTE